MEERSSWLLFSSNLRRFTRRYAFLSMHDAIEDAQLPKEAYQNNPRAGGILGQGGTSIPDVGETLDAVSAGVPRCWGAFTPSMRLVSRNDGSGWSLFRF
jgi:3-oxoacyl-(acyl-carrier-protein) synthase